MQYKVFGPFPLLHDGKFIDAKAARKDLRAQLSTPEYTPEGSNSVPLADARGCYVFVIENKGGARPWYVGKAEATTFATECLAGDKPNMYNGALKKKGGNPALYLVARMKGDGVKFYSPNKGSKPSLSDVGWLEATLIANAFERNEDLLNSQHTKMVKELVVTGFFRSPRAKSGPAKKLREVFFGKKQKRNKPESKGSDAAHVAASPSRPSPSSAASSEAPEAKAPQYKTEPRLGRLLEVGDIITVKGEPRKINRFIKTFDGKTAAFGDGSPPLTINPDATYDVVIG